MINIVSFTSKDKLEKLTPSPETFVIQLSSNSPKVTIESGYDGCYDVECFDDVCSLAQFNTMSFEQARKLVSVLDRLQKSNERIDLYICCDTGVTMSGAVTRFIQKRYLSAKIYQKIPDDSLNQHILSSMELATHKSISSHYTTKRKKSTIKQIINALSIAAAFFKTLKPTSIHTAKD